MENTEKEFDLRKLWWVFRKYLLWIMIAAVLGGVLLGVYTTVSTKTTYTTQSIFLVGSGKETTTNNSATTDYYKIQKAREDAVEIIETIKFSTTVTQVLNDARNPEVDPEVTPAKVKETIGMISASVFKKDSRQIVLHVTSESAAESLRVAMAFEKNLPTYIAEHMSKLNASLTPVETVSSKYFVGYDDEGMPRYSVAADSVPVLRNAILGVLAFGVIAYIVFFVYSTLDTTVHTTDSISGRFPQIPVLGQIPVWTSRKLTRRQRKLEKKGRFRDYEKKLLSEDTPFPVAESFRGLRTNISYIVSGKTTIIGVTSVKSGECKSVVSTNLAICYAQLKKKVLLVEGDMRLPSMHNIFNIEPEVGLPEVLAGIETDYHACIHHHSDYLDVLPVGMRTPPNPTELLASDATADLFGKLREEYDLIILDLPPIGTVSDAGIVAGVVDQYLISTRVELTNARALESVLRDMQRLDMKVCGFVVNGQKRDVYASASPYYSDGYAYAPKQDEGAEENA